MSITALQLHAPGVLSLIDGIAEALPKADAVDDQSGDANSAEAVDHRLGDTKESVAEKIGI